MQGLTSKIFSVRILFITLLIFVSALNSNAAFFSVKSFEKIYVDTQVKLIYQEINEEGMSFEAWNAGFTGFLNLVKKSKLTNSRYLTIVDFSLPSSVKRLFVIDILENRVVFKSLCSHGRNSGGLMATTFSNTNSSYQSSLGFYLTAESYSGKFDYAMRLDGLEYSNSNARERAIVVHGADYATESFLKSNNGVLGRSLGCPSVPTHEAKELIDLVKEGSCFFIYASNQDYKRLSKILKFISGIEDLTELDCIREQYS